MYEFIAALGAAASDVSEVDAIELEFTAKSRRTALSNAQQVRAFTFTYLSKGNKIAGFAVVPNTIAPKMPVIIFNRGGFKDFGLVTDQELFLYLAEMAQWGYVVMGTQYPGNTLSEGKDERGGKSDIQSIIDLHKVIKQLPCANMDQISICAGSRGAMMTTLLLKKVRWVKTAVMIGGEFNAFRSVQQRPEMQAVMDAAFGGGDAGKQDRSAVFWADKLPNDCPLLIMHGAKDERVSPLSALELATKLQQYNKPYRLVIFENGSHDMHEHYHEFMTQTRKWLAGHL